MQLEGLLDHLREFDLLLDTDSKFPSVTGFIAGDTGARSWWAHPQARQMYALSCALRDHPDVLLIKLISGKLTFVRRPLWQAIAAIGTAREPWQMNGLPEEAKSLLKKVDQEGKLTLSGDAVRELENRLLARAASVHTARGFHMKEVQSWRDWALSVHLGKIKLTAAEARAQLDAVIGRLNQQFSANAKLPWQTRRLSRRAL